jgi:hypothetical protein
LRKYFRQNKFAVDIGVLGLAEWPSLKKTPGTNVIILCKNVFEKKQIFDRIWRFDFERGFLMTKAIKSFFEITSLLPYKAAS